MPLSEKTYALILGTFSWLSSALGVTGKGEDKGRRMRCGIVVYVATFDGKSAHFSSVTYVRRSIAAQCNK